MDYILTNGKLIRNVALATSLSVLLTARSYANECTFSGDDFDFADDVEIADVFDRLRSCESDPAVSSDVLYFIALMIGYAESDGDYPGRNKHVYDLVFRAAKLGNEEALIEMPGLYLAGTEKPGFEWNQAIHNCFQELADRAPEEDTDFSGPVKSCLSLAEAEASE